MSARMMLPDRHTKAAYTAILWDEMALSRQYWFSLMPFAWYHVRDITVGRVLTDNGACSNFRKFRATAMPWASSISAPARIGQTNGKAEWFVRAALNEGVYAET